MKTSFEHINPKGIYTGSQAIKETGVPKRSFYRYVKQGKIPKHTRIIDGRTVFYGHELIRALTATEPVLPEVYFIRPTRGRPKKEN